MKTIDVPGVGAVDFPEEMSDEDIVTAIEKEILPQVKAEASSRKEVDDYWSGRGKQEEDDKPGYLSNLARGAGERVLDLAAGGLRSVGTFAEHYGDKLERVLPLGTVGSPGTPMTEEQIRADTVPLTDWAKDLAGTDLGYEPRTTFQDVKENWWKIPEFAIEQGVTSIPDAAAAVFAPGAYAAARTGEIAQTRAENDGRQSATVDDLMRAAPSAAASALLERFGAHGMMGLGDDVVRSFSQLPGAVGRAAAKEGATEFGQEVGDYLGETLGTRKGSTVGEALERGLAGAVGGAPFGGGVRGLTGTIQVWAQSRGVEPTQENLQAAAMTGDTAALDILRTAGMSDEQITSLSPEAAERFAARVEARRAADAAREAPDAIVPDAAPAPIDPVFTPGMTGPERRLAVQEAERLTAERDAGLQAKQLERNTVRGSQRRARTEAERLDAEIDRRRVEEEGLKDGTIDPAAVSRRASRVMTPPPPEPPKVTEARARIAEILGMPGDRTTPDLAMEYVRLNGEVTRHDELTRQGTTRLGDLEDRLGSRMTEGTAAADPGLERATELRGRPNMPAVVDAPIRPMTDEQVVQARRSMQQPPTTAGTENLYADPLTGQASRFGEVVPERTGLALPSPATASRLPMTPEQILQAQAEAARTGRDAARNAGLGPENLRAPEGRLPQTPTQVGEQREADEAFRLVAGKQGPIPGKEDLVTGQRLRAGPDARDTRAGGRPEGGIDSQKKILLDEGRPVKIVDTRTEPRKDGTTRTIYKVHRYDPRTADELPLRDENGEVLEYEVDAAALTVGKYAADPRQAQEMEEAATPPMVGKRRADEVLGLPRQTYRETAPDPAVPGAEGPASEVPGRGPVPRSPRPAQGEGPRVDMGSNKRSGEFRGDETGAEAAARRAETARRAKMREQSQRSQTQDEKTGEKTEWGKARSKYESQADGYSSTAKGVDEDGWPLTDDDGFVLSDAGGPIRFETNRDTKDGKVGVLTVVAAMRKLHPDAMLFPVPHPGPMRQTGPKSAESYWTIQATRPKPKTEQEQTANPETEAAPEQPAQTGPQRALPGPAPTPDPTPEPDDVSTPETPRKDTGKTPETPPADTENTPVRNPEQLVAGAEKALRDRQVKPNPKALARHLGIDEGQAANVLATIAGRSNKVIRQARPSRKELAAALRPREGAEAPAPKGPRYRLAPQFDEDMSLLEFLMSKGGLERDGDLVAMDAHRKSHPRYGNLVRKQGGGGLTLDEARELAEGEGYIGGTDDYNTATIPDLLEAIEEELRGTRVTTERAGSGSERDQMEARARELGIDVNPDWNDAELMVEIGEADAIANEDNPTVEAADDLRDVVDAMLVELGIFPDTYQADFDIPFGDERAGPDQGAGEVGAEAEGAAETTVDGAGRQAPDVRPGGRAAASGTGDAQEAGREGRRREPRVEKTDQGDQYVFPGEVGDLSGAETLKGKGPRKRADEGLFAKDAGPEPEQIDLEDAIAAAKVDEKPKSEAQAPSSLGAQPDAPPKVVDEVVKKTPATKPTNPPKRKERAALLSRLFGRDLKAEPTAEQEAADEAAWKERLEQIAPRAETVADIERILDGNVERGILDKATAKGIKSILGRMPTDGLKGVRLMIRDRMTAEEREILGTAKGVSGEYITLADDADTRVLTVLGENGSKDAVETFVHENAHVLFGAISNPDKALARQIYDRLPISRQALHTAGYDKEARFEEWFAESAVDHYADGLKIDGQRAGIPHMLGGLMQRLFKRIVDAFSNEKAQVAAFFSGLERSLGYSGPVSVEGITKRERRGVSTLAILSNPIGSLTGDWKAWRSGYQELARDVTETWKNPRPNRQNAAAGFARWFFYSADGEYRAAIGKFNSPTLNMLADTFHAKAGSRHGLDSKLAGKLGMKLSSNATFDESVTRKVGVELNQLSRILKPFEQDAAAMDRIVDLVQKPASRRSDPESKAAGEIARQLASLHKYMTDSGVDVGQIKNGYFPREIDVAAVIKNHAGFVTQATKAYQSSGLGAKEAKEAADRWLTTVLFGGSGSPVRDAKAGAPNFVQSRVLTKQADEILKEFYQRDPGMVLGSYIGRAVKRAEIARRFGDNWKNWESIEKQVREEDPAAAGMLDLVREYAATAAGVRQDGVSGLIRQGSSMVRTVTSVSLLEKSTLTSLGEAVMPAIRTGSLLDVIPTIGKTLREFRRDLAHMPPSVAAELAADIGAIAGSGVNSLMAARFASGDPLGRGQARVLSAYFRRILQEQWTNATRVAATERGAIFIRRLAGDIAGKGWSPKASRVYMEEMGVPAGQIDQFVAYVNGFGNDLPTPSDLDKGGEMGAAYRTALLRFVDQAIMRPTTTTKPRWASHPVGAVLFQLQAFNYAFAKNTVLRNLQLAKTAATPSADLDKLDRLALAYPVIMMLPLLGLVQFVVGDLIRDRLFMDPERRKAQTATARIEKVISRTGLLGALDPYVQMVSGARYQKDPISTLTGPFFGILGSGLGALQQYVGNNSPNTNAAERKATEALYDTLFEPMVNIVLGYSPASPLATLITMGLIPGLRDDFVDGVAGPRVGHTQPKIYGVTEILAGKQFEKKSGSWAAGG